MRHGIKLRKLGRNSSHRKALLKNLTISLVEHEQIKTTVAKAKALKPVIERFITLAKKGDLHSRRLLLARIGSHNAVNKLINDIAERVKNRNGGYTRVLKCGYRYGDCAPMAIISLVDIDLNEKQPTEEKDNNSEASSE